MIEIINHGSIDFVVILGDLLDNHDKIDMRAYNRMEYFIHRISELKPTYILVGNHDRPNNKVYLSTTEHIFNPFKRWPNVIIVDTCYRMNWRGKEVCHVPFVPDGMFMQALVDCNIDWRDINLFFSHSEFVGCSINKFSKNKCDYWRPEYPLNIAGHIHDQEVVSPNLIYVGTPFQHGYAESSNKGLFLLNQDLQLEMIEIPVPKKLTKRISYQDIENVEVRPNEKLKLVIEGPTALINEILLQPQNVSKFENVKIVFNDNTKAKKKLYDFKPNISFIDRLNCELSKNPEMAAIFALAFPGTNPVQQNFMPQQNL